MTDTLATFTASDDDLMEMLDLGVLAKDIEYQHAYLNVTPEAVHLVSAVPGSSALSYSTFDAGGHLSSIEVHTDDNSVEALIDIDVLEFYLDVVSGHNLTVKLTGDPDDELATTCELHGSLNVSLHLPQSESILDKMPRWAIQRFDDEEVWRGGDDRPDLTTEIYTTVDDVQRIIKLVDADDVSNFNDYPIVVEDGQFKVEVGDGQSRTQVWGDLSAGEVDGDDVGNFYGRGFKPIFNALYGDVRLNTAPDGAPMTVVKELDGATLRHAVTATGTVN